MRKMTSRERILSALNHEEPDRLPLDIGGTTDTSFIWSAYRDLKGSLEINNNEQPEWYAFFAQIVIPEEIVLNRLGVDTRSLSLGGATRGKDRWNEDGSFTDEWGITRIRGTGSPFYDQISAPLQGECSLEDVEKYPWPNPRDPGRYLGLKEKAEFLHRRTDYAVILSLPPPFVHQSQFLRGMEDWCCDLVLHPELIGALMDRILDSSLTMYELALSEVGGNIDIVHISDDIAIQTGPICSPQTYRSIIKPRQKRVFDFLKNRTSAKIHYHSCGSMCDLLEDIIELGMDAYHPVQLTATKMDTKILKERFGDRITFWGGMDIHKVLSKGTEMDVASEVRRLASELGQGGGYVLAATHNILPNTPPQNVLSMCETAHLTSCWSDR